MAIRVMLKLLWRGGRRMMLRRPWRSKVGERTLEVSGRVGGRIAIGIGIGDGLRMGKSRVIGFGEFAPVL